MAVRNRRSLGKHQSSGNKGRSRHASKRAKVAGKRATHR